DRQRDRRRAVASRRTSHRPAVHCASRMETSTRDEAMSYSSITVTSISPKIGAEIGDIDLTKPLSPKQVEEVHRAFIQFGVIFFRDQKISHDDQIRFGRYFGELGAHVGVTTISKKTDNPYVRKFHYDETSTKVSGDLWHTDQ